MEAGVSCDLIVVGGGPAGCAAAITAARAGASVILFERGRFPRHKVCGEFVSAESLGLLAHLLRGADSRIISAAPRIGASRIFIDGAVLSAAIDPPAASIARFDLDLALWQACLRAGVAVRSETTVQAIEGGGPFQVNTNGGRFTARALINASGRWSNLTSAAVRAQVAGQRWIGIKAHFREFDTPSSVDLYFFPGGYCGVQRLDESGERDGGRVNACAMVRADVASSIEEVLRKHPALFERSRKWKKIIDPVSTSPLVFHDPEPVCGGTIQVGDSAAFVDPFIGDGISLALRSGNLAADCLQPFFAEMCSLEPGLEAYRKAYAQRLARVFRNSSRLRNTLRWPKVIRKPVLSFLARTPALTRQLVRMTR